MIKTIRFGLLEPDFFLRRVLPKIEEIEMKTNWTRSNAGHVQLSQGVVITLHFWWLVRLRKGVHHLRV